MSFFHSESNHNIDITLRKCNIGLSLNHKITRNEYFRGGTNDYSLSDKNMVKYDIQALTVLKLKNYYY